MTLLLGFAPLVVFCVLVRLSVSLALWIGLATAFSLTIRAFVETGVLRLLDAGFTVLFAILALTAGFIEPGMPIAWVGMVLELGLLAIALWSLLVRRPFVGPYLRAPLDAEHWTAAPVVGLEYRLSWIWAATFAAMAATDAVILFVHTLSANLAAGAGLAALAGALTYTWQSGVALGRRLGHHGN